MAGPYLRSHANEIVAALVVSPRGSGTAAAPGLAASEIGQRWSSGLALTNRRLLTLDLAISMMGGVKEVKARSARSRSSWSTG